jgi:hypothetical protein
MDYMYQSVYLAYFLFFVLSLLTVAWFFIAGRRGYWGPNSEEPKYRMMSDDHEGGTDGR